MPHTEEQSKQLPLPRSSEAHPDFRASHDYDGFIRKFHHHNLSDSTNTTGSNDSSPTTTISTVDDSSATEPSPGSSPESPPPTTFTVGMLRPRTADERSAPFFELQKQPPPRKGRNLKNLAVVTSRHPARAASTTSLPLEAQPHAAPSILSPSFVKPPTPPRRKPSNLGLTLLTPGGSKPVPQLAIPPTPGFARPGALRHFQSSPSLPLVPGFALPHHNAVEFQKQRALDTIFSPVAIPSESPPIPEADEEEQNFDVPLSREEQPQAYPEGPICVYDPYIDLYLEPTAEQARQYDVVMNVASEVRNPLINENSGAMGLDPELRIDGGGGIQFKPRQDRDHLVVRKSELQDNASSDASPTTPKASPMGTTFSSAHTPTQEPEYIHVKWEHNSDIVPDLLRLCKLIDERVTQGKRVLVHCQCGVSRSASLVVAYGLYKNPSMSVQEAYDAIKRRSKWIGPNMNLIMQLQEFRSSLARGGLLTSRSTLSTLSPLTPGSALSEWHGPFSSKSPPVHGEPQSAIDPPANDGTNDSLGAVSPGPSSAPSGFPWPTPATVQKGSAAYATRPSGPFVDPSGHVVPVMPLLKIVAAETLPADLIRQSSTPESVRDDKVVEPIQSPRSLEFAMAPIRPDVADAADDFGIMSPTSTEFASNPFDRSALLARLGMGSMRADEETPRRSVSLRNQNQQQSTHSVGTATLEPGRKLRAKISSPSLREQQQLLGLQARIEANLHMNESRQDNQSTVDDSDTPMSPRATHFTENPFALAIPSAASTMAGNTECRSTVQDPRSPAQKGASPITRNILDVLL
ncbi:Putative tyrosine-specific protein phosphatase [Septoria linicola]|uniref:protein-tyrosine-phosphatase n=1 Tax=Septoria linicola TaxID=215465 RepID=A0A9Q9AJ16_9PEZI|nr:putative tyrosine-specific protein phosphatase [Septoria linicola]USW47350.1 Putative tyrosine-specific protein phosphatase [Septoria linicola]